MNRLGRAVSLAAIAAVGVVGVAACGDSAPGQSQSNTPSNSIASTGQSSNGLTTVTVASDNAPAQAGIILADKLGFFAQEGIKIEYKTFASGEDELTALSAGQVDVARGVVSAGLFNAVEQGIHVKLVADGGQNQPNKPYFEIVLSKSAAGKVKNYGDLKGLRIGVASQGTINEEMLGKALQKGGLKLSDVKEVVVDSFPYLNTAVANGALDGAVQIEPLITEGVEKGYLSWWKNPTDYDPTEPVSIIEYGSRLLSDHDLGDRFMIAYLQGVRAYDDALIFGNKDQQKIISLMAGATFVSDPSMWLKMNNPYLDPNGAVPQQGLKNDLNWYVSQGQTQQTDVNNVVDNSFVQDALKKIGPDSHSQN